MIYSCDHFIYRFPKGFDIYKEPYEGYTHRPHFLKQEEITQYAVKNSCPELTWNLYGFPMPQISFKFEGKEIELVSFFCSLFDLSCGDGSRGNKTWQHFIV